MLRKISAALLLLAFTMGGALCAEASESSERILSPDVDAWLPLGAPLLEPAERYHRAEAVLAHFGAPAEIPNAAALDAWESFQNEAGLRRLLPDLDPKGQFGRFFTFDGRGLRGFLDADAKAVGDFEVGLAAAGEPLRNGGLAERLTQAARRNPSDRPLLGLKIAIDPGHMGSSLWDTRTGKLVKGKNGLVLSEGLMNLQTALLLKERLEHLGATVFLTRQSLRPVTNESYEKLSIGRYAREELRSESLSPWFHAILGQYPAGDSLFLAFQKSRPFQKLFSEINRINYFSLRADLEARWKAIEAFGPDITLIVHYDASSPTNTVQPHPIDGTKVYVVGAFDAPEFATQKSRLLFAKHLLDQEGGDASLRLARSVAGSLKEQLGIGFDQDGGGYSKELEPGVFARNLGVSAGLSAHAVAYIECLHYDDPREFQRLLDRRYPLLIDGKNEPYSDRLLEAVKAIESGVLGFVRGYSEAKPGKQEAFPH